MDHQRFFRELPGLYEYWAGPGCRPRSRRFDEVLASVRGMTTPGILQLLNYAVGCLEGDEVYCEIGCFRGSTLIGAMLDRPSARAEAVDNFSEFDPQGRNQQALSANLERFGMSRQVCFANADFEKFLMDRRRERRPPIGVYLYDGAHDYRSQLMGLLLAVPHLSERALIIVDDANFPAVRQATWDFLAAFPTARLELEVRTPGNGTPDFWNGLHVLAWDSRSDNRYGHETVRAYAERALVASISALQRVHLREEGDSVRIVAPG